MKAVAGRGPITSSLVIKIRTTSSVILFGARTRSCSIQMVCAPHIAATMSMPRRRYGFVSSAYRATWWSVDPNSYWMAVRRLK